MKLRFLAGALVAALPYGASAEVKFAAADGLLIEHRFTIAAPAGKVWESLLHPEPHPFCCPSPPGPAPP